MIKKKKSSLLTIYHPAVSKVTLDIICSTAFAYEADSLHDPHNELALAYEKLIDQQNGRNLAYFIGLVSVIPGLPTFLNSRFGWRVRKLISPIPNVGKVYSIVSHHKS
jgi:hypothetical protein